MLHRRHLYLHLTCKVSYDLLCVRCLTLIGRSCITTTQWIFALDMSSAPSLESTLHLKRLLGNNRYRHSSISVPCAPLNIVGSMHPIIRHSLTRSHLSQEYNPFTVLHCRAQRGSLSQGAIQEEGKILPVHRHSNVVPCVGGEGKSSDGQLFHLQRCCLILKQNRCLADCNDEYSVPTTCSCLGEKSSVDRDVNTITIYIFCPMKATVRRAWKHACNWGQNHS